MNLLRLIALALFAAIPLSAENLVLNGDFSAKESIAPWILRVSAGCKATVVNNGGEASILVVEGGASRWTVNLEQPLSAPLRQGVRYAVSFDVRSDAPRRIDALIRAPGGPILGSAYSIPVSGERRRETFAYTHTGEDTPARIAFRLGGEAVALSIDNIVVEPVPASPPAQPPPPDTP